jgi:hypothetical protein
MLTVIGAVLLFVVGGGLALAALTRSRQRGGGFTTIGAILGFVAGGVLALAAFPYVVGVGISFVGEDKDYEAALLGYALVILFAVPLFLLGSIIGTTIGALVGGRIDRRKAKVSVTRRVIGVAYTVNGALCAVFSLPAIILGAYGLYGIPGVGWLWLVAGIGIAAVAVGAGLCFAGRRVLCKRHQILQGAS